MKMLDGSLTETVYGIDQHSWSLETKRKYLLQKSAVAYIRGFYLFVSFKSRLNIKQI